MLYSLFVILNGIAYWQPAAFDESLADLYMVFIAICALVAFPLLVVQLPPSELVSRPITLLVLLFLLSIPLSHLCDNFSIYEARMGLFEIFKVVLYYLVFVSAVNSVERLRAFMRWLVFFICVLTIAALLQYYGIINVPALGHMNIRATNEDTMVEYIDVRVRSVGTLNDPNDFATTIAVAVLFCIYFATEPGSQTRGLWWFPIIPMMWSFVLTLSRGGMLGLVAGLAVLSYARFGAKRTVLVGLLFVPILVAVGGRQGEIGTDADTAQQRVHIWNNALVALYAKPFFGVGHGRFAEEVGENYVCHNSFLHAYTELGMAGGTFFLGAFLYAIYVLYRLRQQPIRDPVLRRLCPYLLAFVISYATGLMSLSRCYVSSPFMLLAMVTVYLNLVAGYTPMRFPRASMPMALRLAASGVGFIIFMFFFVRFTYVEGG
jgi:O-antigen ligase